MRPKALQVLVALDGEMPLATLARDTGLSTDGASRAVRELEGLALASRRRSGIQVLVRPLPHPARDPMRLEFSRFPELDLARAVRGRRADLLAGIGFARPAFLRRAVGLSKGAAGAAFKVFKGLGLLRLDDETKYRVSDGHRPLQAFCQAICDMETRRWMDHVGLKDGRVLWSRGSEALVAVPDGATPTGDLKAAAYTAAAARGVAFLGRDRYYIRSKRRQVWPDALLQCLLVPPRTRLSRTHAIVMYAAKRRQPLAPLARWYGVEEEAGRILAFVDAGRDDPLVLPRGDVLEIAERYGVSVD